MALNSLSYLEAVHHDGSEQFVSNPYPKLGEVVQIRLRTAPDESILRVLLRSVPDGEQHFTDLSPLKPEVACRWWQGELRISMPIENYRFLLYTTDGVWHYNGLGVQEHTPADYNDFRLLTDYRPPLWVTESVFYQIFPDRFCDGDPSNNVHDGEWIYKGHPVCGRKWEEPPKQGENSEREFFGGDLQGITKQLEYLSWLGVNTIYLNPIFEASSSHRYDTKNYGLVDPHLGGDKALAELCHSLHHQGMHLILDLVPNHCSIEHPWFQEAIHTLNASSAEYFIFTRYPDRYVSWMEVPNLPKLNYKSKALREIMYSGKDAVIRRWLRPPYSIDGWRIDVANMLGRWGTMQLGPEIARGICAAVKEENPQAYLLGENFYDATSQLKGDEYDANMNYSGFSIPLWEWLAGQYIRLSPFDLAIKTGTQLSTTALTSAWTAFRAPIPWAIAIQQFNLVDSHDTARIFNLVGGSYSLLRLAVTIQMTYPGVPCVFYGDEIGLEGKDSDSARSPMRWNASTWNRELFAFYQQMIQLRRFNAALCRGGFQLLLVETHSLAYLRSTKEEIILVVGHRGECERPSGIISVWQGALADGTHFHELFTGSESTVKNGGLLLPPMHQGAAIWLAHL